ncbi:MAG: fumarylacetoacetate hydrolase family protein [Candidatus Methanoperedens sp.]|nr:fumarylacetoacetate hydrolase family protein [Candidatus Methanoperedens sp.]
MIGRFKFDNETFQGEVRKDRVVVNRGLYSDTFILEELEILPPTNPGKIICVGLNYTDHARELGMPLPKNPLIFLKPPSSTQSHNGMIEYPDQVRRLDYEGELAIIIGKKCRNVQSSIAGSVIMGYTCFNDITARDLQKVDGQWTRSKSFDTFAPIGPFITDPDLDVSDLFIRTRVNGELRQDSRTSKLIFNIPRLIEFISGIMTLEPGDVIATGTPPGVGELHVGDNVEVEIENIGVLKNRVIKARTL